MPGIFYPRHVLRIAAVLETFDGSPTAIDRAVEWQVIPRSAKLERNDVHTADRLTAVVDFKEFPFDPRLVRAASVTYYAGNTGGGALALDATTMRFLGVVDTPETFLSEDAQTVTFDCRDYTAILLGQRATPAMAVALDRSLRAVLVDLLATLPGEMGTLLTPVIQGPDGAAIEWPNLLGGRAGARLVVEPKDTLWSIIRRVVEGAGLIAYVELDRLVVSTPRTLGTDGQLRDAPRLHVVFGENLADLRMKRTLQNRVRPVVLAQYDPRTSEVTRTTWPPSALAPRPSRRRRGRVDVATRRTGGATVSNDESDQGEEFPVTGHRTQADLERLAESIYRQRALYDLDGSFTTHDPVLPQIRDGGEQAPDFDLWGVHTATTLYADLAAHAVAFDTLATRADKERYLTARGYDPVVAAALVTSWNNLARLSLPFLVRKATLGLDGESGFRAEVEFMAMLQPQTDGALPQAQATAPRTQTVTFSDATLVRGR